MSVSVSHSSRANHGFTLIELVVVIILLGILSVGASSLFSSRDQFGVYTARQQFVSAALLAQQAALASQDEIRLVFSESASKWHLEILRVESSSVQHSLLSQDIERAGASVVISPVPTNNTFVYTRDGSLPASYLLTFSGSTTAWVCFSASGFAFNHASGTCP